MSHYRLELTRDMLPRELEIGVEMLLDTSGGGTSGIPAGVVLRWVIEGEQKIISFNDTWPITCSLVLGSSLAEIVGSDVTWDTYSANMLVTSSSEDPVNPSFTLSAYTGADPEGAVAVVATVGGVSYGSVVAIISLT